MRFRSLSKSTPAIITALLVMICLCSCTVFEKGAESSSGSSESSSGGEASLVGTWQYEDRADITYTFKSNGTGAYSYDGQDTKYSYHAENSVLTITYTDNGIVSKFKYTIDGDKLNIIDSFGKDNFYYRQ